MLHGVSAYGEAMAQRARSAVLLPRGTGGLMQQCPAARRRADANLALACVYCLRSFRFRLFRPLDPSRPFTMLRAGPGTKPAHRNRQPCCQPDGCAVVRTKTRMKKIAFFVFLLAVCVAAGRAQESRQDISLSGTCPYRAVYRLFHQRSGALEHSLGSAGQLSVHAHAIKRA